MATDKATRNWKILGSGIAWCTYVFLLMPNLVVVAMSFGNADEMIFPPRGLSTYLYQRYFSDASWTSATLLSLQVGAAAAVLSMAVGVPAAYGFGRGSMRHGRGPAQFLLLSPMLVPVVVIALGMYLYFGRIGISGTAALILAHTVYVLPFVLVTTGAGMRQLDPRVELAAEVMGARRLRVLGTVVLPQLIPALVSSALIAFLLSFDEVVLAWFLGSVRTTTLPVKMFNSIQWEISPVIAAVATLLTALSVVICVVAAYLQPQKREE